MLHLVLLHTQLQGTRGKLMQVPEFARPPATSEGGAPPVTSFLVAWEVDAEQGTGPVLLLARAAHCLQQLHVAVAGRQAVAATEYWQVLAADSVVTSDNSGGMRLILHDLGCLAL